MIKEAKNTSIRNVFLGVFLLYDGNNRYIIDIVGNDCLGDNIDIRENA